MNRYGDTPLGMVESALEFARIAREHDYHAFVFSMKASNPKVMIKAYRLLVARLNELGPDWNYPIHLGVTEAGDGEDGRIKSAIGIGSLLHDGIGDTVRVSLTEDSVHEIPVAQALVAPFNAAGGLAERLEAEAPLSYDPFHLLAPGLRDASGDLRGGAWQIRLAGRARNCCAWPSAARRSRRSRTRSRAWATTSRSSSPRTPSRARSIRATTKPSPR